jgi:Protein of unknown function (DUF1064)
MKKWKAKKAYCAEGHKHDSLSEAKRCDQLHEMLERNEIEDLLVWPQFWFVINGRQVKHENGRRVGYLADFQYTLNGQEIVEDVKPSNKAADSRDWPIRKAIFRALFPTYELREIRPGRRKGETPSTRPRHHRSVTE